MHGPNGFERLTPREIEVLKLVATGLSTKEIARSLGIAFKTAACHRGRVMAKLSIHEVATLTRYAIQHGYVDIDENAGASELQERLFERVRMTEAKYHQAMDAYHLFLQEHETIGLENPDSSPGAQQLRHAGEAAHTEYHAALVAMKDFLIPK